MLGDARLTAPLSDDTEEHALKALLAAVRLVCAPVRTDGHSLTGCAWARRRVPRPVVQFDGMLGAYPTTIADDVRALAKAPTSSSSPSAVQDTHARYLVLSEKCIVVAARTVVSSALKKGMAA